MSHPPLEILVVDDNPNNLHLVRTLLTEHGYKVRLATSGQMGLTSATSCPPDLILLDVDMPDLNGFEVCKRLKANPTTKLIPIIFLSAMNQTFDKVQAFTLGGVDYLTKPFDESELLARLNTHLMLNWLREEEKRTNRILEDKVQDLTLALKAAKTLASHHLKYNLFSILMNLFQEATEASQGALLIKRGEQWVIEAVIQNESDPAQGLIFQSLGHLSNSALPTPMIDQVIQSQETIVFNDLTNIPEAVLGIEYVNLHHPQSCLAAPIVAGETVVGVVYLENPHTTGHFTQNRMNMVHLLGAQAASAIENDQFYVTLKKQTEDLNQAKKRVEAELKERKLLERQLIQSQKMESIGQLAAGIAHEINTPVQFVGDNVRFLGDSFKNLTTFFDKYKCWLQMVDQSGVPDTLVQESKGMLQEADWEYLEKEIPLSIHQSLEGVERIATIVKSLKEFSHPGMKERVHANLNHCIETTITVAKNEWKYVAELKTDLDPQLPLIPCLVNEFNQVMLNIIINAAHAIAEVVKNSGDKGRLTISTTRIGEWAEVRISDTGAGIPESIRSKLFDPFFTTKKIGKGTGLGLALAHTIIVDQHGGTIDFQSTPGTGTTFIIRLPIQTDPAIIAPAGDGS